MEVNLRCPQGHISRWVLGNIIDSFEIFCSACNRSYIAILIPDGTWIVREKTDPSSPVDSAGGKLDEDTFYGKGRNDNG